MLCDYFQRGVCQSCPHINNAYDAQFTTRRNRIVQHLEGVRNTEHMRWLDPMPSDSHNFRAKAKMAVGGTPSAPTLGLLDAQWNGIDLSRCPILSVPLRDAMSPLKTFMAELKLEPYDVSKRRGEVKYVHLTASESGELMLRFVLRSRRYESLLRSRLGRLRQLLPQARVVTLNLLPQHAAVLEGEEEFVLTDDATLPMRFGDVDLRVGPRSFIQTNTRVASELYRQVTRWMDALPERVHTVWDLYCGVGGFALHAALGGAQHVVGVEISDTAIASASQTADEIFGEDAARRTSFIAGDAREWARQQEQRPDVLIVNPPRRGIGAELAQWINDSGVPTLVYSSCNARTLAEDLIVMGNYRVVEGRVFDMFPHTNHSEVAVLCQRIA